MTHINTSSGNTKTDNIAVSNLRTLTKEEQKIFSVALRRSAKLIYKSSHIPPKIQ